ncbi:MAG: TonB-dependent receptor, partial [Candidatus Marinimicrobia bacterium]|nr:TonB-dependent receptor [Candidatus Neomarinimicrobiota bacterium]
LNDVRKHKEKWISEQKFISYDTTYNDTNSLGISAIIDTSLIRVLPGYIGSYDVIGKEWSITAKFQNRRKIPGNLLRHHILNGVNVSLKKNTGDGFIVDPEWSYYGQYSPRRSYSYNDYKSLQEINLYTEDNIKTKLLGRKLTTIIGFRYDLYNMTGLDFNINDSEFEGVIVTQHGGFLCPRVNVKYDITDNFHLRFGAGTSSKAISLSYINRAPSYLEYMADDTTRVVEVEYQQNPYLTAYTTDKYEVSLDYKINNFIGLSLTGYQNESKNMPSTMSYPWGYRENPDTLSTASYMIYENNGWSKSQGLEFTLKTKRFKSMSYQLNVTYRQSDRGRAGNIYDSRPDTTWEEIWYAPKSTEREKILIDHRITFVNQRLGVWVTMDIQNVVLDHYRYTFNGNSTIREIDGVDRTWYQGMSQYWWETEWISYDARWRADFRLTKSLNTKSEVSLYINNFLDNRGE